jgi:drug/metabolite transporter (DMT)-like permease
MMFLASVALYLTVRKSSLIKIPTPLTNLAMFGIPLVAYVTMGLSTSQSYSISTLQLLLLLIAGVIFAYGGNTASLKAIGIAPNPGYSLVLSKSYVLFTTVVAVLFLHANLSLRKAIAILIIVAFSGIIMVNFKHAKQVKSNRWILLSFGAFFAWGSLSLTSKYLFNHGLSTIPFLIYLYAIVTACIIISNKIKRSSFRNLSKQKWFLLLSTGVFSTLFNLGQFEAIKVAPNVGYVNAINASSISLVTLLAALLFKDELTKKKAIGIIGITCGLLLLLV